MTEQRNDGNDGRLETLYRKAGDVEPDAGLDRIIRARADAAVGSRRSSNRLPWLGGLATASVAIVAIAVVLQQAPPDEQVPASIDPEESDEARAFMAPSMGAQSQSPTRAQRQTQSRPQLDVSAPARGPAAELGKENVSSSDTPALQSPESLPQAAGESRQRREAISEAEPATPPVGQDDPALDRMMVNGARSSLPNPAALESRDAVIEKLREMIEAGRIDEAHRLLDAAVDLYPELDVPDDIEQALDLPAPSDEASQDPESDRGAQGASPGPDNRGE